VQGAQLAAQVVVGEVGRRDALSSAHHDRGLPGRADFTRPGAIRRRSTG
jgi:hypothetical protein